MWSKWRFRQFIAEENKLAIDEWVNRQLQIDDGCSITYSFFESKLFEIEIDISREPEFSHLPMPENLDFSFDGNIHVTTWTDVSYQMSGEEKHASMNNMKALSGIDAIFQQKLKNI